jgi:hypothetical protein
MPEVFTAVMESMKKARDTESGLAKLARHEARLTSDLYRTLRYSSLSKNTNAGDSLQ